MQRRSRTECRLHNQVDAHYVLKIRQQHQKSTFHRQARQFGSGGMGAFDMQLGQMAMPLMEKYILPVAKELGGNIVKSFVPEFTKILSGENRPRKSVRDVLKNQHQKLSWTLPRIEVLRRTAKTQAVAAQVALRQLGARNYAAGVRTVTSLQK